MNKLQVLLGAVVVLVGARVWAQAPSWSIEGQSATVDSCGIACPCILGEAPTHGHCNFAGIMHITKGRYGQVDLSDTNLAVAGQFGHSHQTGGKDPNFVAYYIDANAKPEQREAIKQMLKEGIFAAQGTPLEVKELPITLTGWENFAQVGKTLGGTVGEVMKIEVTPVGGGTHSDKPLVIENTAEPLFYWTALGKASNSFYRGAGQDNKFEGTSGETHKFALSSEPAK